MSKKISISIPNKVKPNLVKLFREYISNKSSHEYSHGTYDEDWEDMYAYWDQMFPGWDDDDSDIVYPSNNVIVMNPRRKEGKKSRDVYDMFWDGLKGGKHKHSKNKKKKGKLIDINAPYSGEEDDFNFDDVDVDYTNYDNDSELKEIWFYPDYHDKFERLHFSNLKEFNDYCDSMGYYVDYAVVNDIAWRYESHCCLNRESEREGLLEILSAHSYGEMFYDVCDEDELSDVD